MRKLTAFNSISLDGYFTDAKGDMSWAHEGGDDPEFAAFTAGNAEGGGPLVFGRVTYEMMAAFWPTAQAAQAFPAVAEGMNKAEKIVFSRKLREAAWTGARLVKGDPAAEAAKLKAEAGPDLTILGSGQIIAQLARPGLIDEYSLVVCPIALGGGRTLFEGLDAPVRLKLLTSRSFRNGKVFARYAPA